MLWEIALLGSLGIYCPYLTEMTFPDLAAEALQAKAQKILTLRLLLYPGADFLGQSINRFKGQGLFKESESKGDSVMTKTHKLPCHFP